METTQKNQTLALSKEFEMTESQLNTIINTIAKGATVSELKLFLHIAKKTGLDPFSRQIHFVKRKSKQPDGTYKETGTVQTGIDGYRAIAERSRSMAGNDDAIFDSETGKNPKKATVTVHRMLDGENVSFTASARWEEYCQKNYKTGEPAGLWAKMPYLMLGKCAEALALRKAFPNDLSGLYTNEEMSQVDYHEDPSATVIDSEVVDTPKKIQNISPDTSKALFAEWKKFYDTQGKDPKQSPIFMKETLKKEFGVESSRLLTEEQAKGFVERLRKTNNKKKEAAKAAKKKAANLTDYPDVPPFITDFNGNPAKESYSTGVEVTSSKDMNDPSEQGEGVVIQSE